MYKVGDIIWNRGDEVVIISEPFILNGGEFQTAVDETGKQLIVATPAQIESDKARSVREWKNLQDGFRRLRENS